MPLYAVSVSGSSLKSELMATFDFQTASASKVPAMMTTLVIQHTIRESESVVYIYRYGSLFIYRYGRDNRARHPEI